ncbi:MAG: dGTPase [Rhodospirillaceae bacterium]|nr:MAG: dGTPase [Rhodospirillaceae bacterium]
MHKGPLPECPQTGSFPAMMTVSSLAPYACHPDRSRGRRHPEPACLIRSLFQRDRDRVIHSDAFRRLKHKTQVFIFHEGDHYQTRLTHSLEVAQIARSVCRVLGLNEDLTETLALVHDLGHPPFGHAGEEALKVCMAPYDGFDHNVQALRVVTRLEHRYAAFDGLNLTWETLEGMAKHNGPLPPSHPMRGMVSSLIMDDARRYDSDAGTWLELETWPSLEAQIVALADDIAYNNHDLDDGLRAGLFTIDDLEAVPLAAAAFAVVKDRYPGLEWSRLVHESVRRLIHVMVMDLVEETRCRIAAAQPDSPESVRRLDRPLAALSDSMRGNDVAFKSFLFPNMYRHDKVNHMIDRARRVVTGLFNVLVSEPRLLPEDWRCAEARTSYTARLVADYIAGMTDRYAIEAHTRLLG